MILRSLTVWLVILVFASVNGAFRDLVLTPHLGDPTARAISTLVLCALISGVTWVSIGWMAPRTGTQALMIGAGWLTLTLAFELGAGHFLFHRAWPSLLEDYNLRRGRIWVLALVVTLLAPLWAARTRRLLQR